MNHPREVVITGVGVVSPIGIGKDEFWKSLQERRSGVATRAVLDGMDTGFRIGAPVTDFDGKQFVKPRKSLKLMCREIQFGYAAAKLAMNDAALESGQYDPDRLGVVFGSELMYSDFDEMEPVYRHCLAADEPILDAWPQYAMHDVHPLWMLKHLPNMAACHIGIACDARSHNNTLVSDESSSLAAVIEAAQVILRGQADIMLAGGTGSRINMTSMVYYGEAKLSRRIDDPQAASRPFDASRDGMVLGEGSAAFVLESRQNAEARGAALRARYLGHGQTYGPPEGSQRKATISRSIQVALDRGKPSTSKIGHVNAHGRSTIADDAHEAAAIRETLGDTPVTAPKSFFGHLGAGGAAVEMAASVMALEYNEVPVTMNYEKPDPQCPIQVVHGSPYRPAERTALILTQSRMGQATSVLLAGDA